MTFSTTQRKEQEGYEEQILTKAIKAGRRTYFLDVRATRDDDYYLTLTESRKKTNADGSFHLIDIRSSFIKKILQSSLMD